MPDFTHLTITAFYATLLTAVVAALWKGGAPERYGVGVLGLMFVVQIAAYTKIDPILTEVDGVALLSDTIGVIGFTALALNARRWWPMFAAALQILSLTSHLSRLIESDIVFWAYSWMKSMPTAIVVYLIIIGVICHQVKLKRYGFDPDWVDWELASLRRKSLKGKSNAR